MDALSTAGCRSLISAVQGQPGLVKFSYISSNSWPLRSCAADISPHDPGPNSSTVRIAVLDSSFNPPTLAHLALASSPYPSYESNSLDIQYDARLLLLSVRNADKTIKAGDAKYEQRLEMMHLLAQALQSDFSTNNVAVAVIDEPTFVRKSSALLRVIRERLLSLQMSSPTIELTFLVGFDTLERLFAPRYYPDASEEAMFAALHKWLNIQAEGGEGAKVVCAYRISEHEQSKVQKALPAAEIFVQAGRISYISLPLDIVKLSSSDVRRLSSSGDDNWRRMVPSSIAKYVMEYKLYSCDVI